MFARLFSGCTYNSLGTNICVRQRWSQEVPGSVKTDHVTTQWIDLNSHNL